MKLFRQMLVIASLSIMSPVLAHSLAHTKDKICPSSSMIVYLEKDPMLYPQCPECERKVAFDISGSSIRMLVADVNRETKILEKLFNAKIDIDFRKDIAQSPDKKFSAEIQKLAKSVLKQLQKAADRYQPQAYTAVAAEAFCFAGNGEQMLKDLSVACQLPIHILSQQQKGQLEFLSGVANSHVPAEHAIVIDMCSAHAHITGLNDEGSIVTFGRKLGYGSIDELIAKKIRKLEKTPLNINPVKVGEVLQVMDYLDAQFEEMSQVLKEKLSSKDSYVIATFTPVVGEESWKNTNSWQFLCDQILPMPSSDKSPILTSKAIFMCALINKFNIKECKLIGSDVTEGSTSGVLISDQYFE